MRWVASVIAAALLAGAATGQETPLELGLEEQVEVQLVLVDLLALDRQERTVPDLTADDLTLLVDGRETALASFDRDCPSGATDDPFAGRVARAEPVAANAPTRQIVLVFDYYHMTNAAETFDRLGGTLERWATGAERHMVVSLGDAVRIELPLTDDAGALRQTLERMRNDPSLYAGNHGSLTEWPFYERIGMLFDLLERVAGRKTIVLFSGPFAPDGFYHDPAHRALSALSTIARTSIYPVDTGGLRTPTDPLATRLGGPEELRRLANDTGGRMTADTNDIGLAYARARRDLSCTYTLGFYDVRPRADDERRITIRVAREGVRVVYPEFYEIRSPEAKRKSLLRTASMAPQMFEHDAVRTELFLLGPRSGRRWRALLAVEVRLLPGAAAAAGERLTVKGLLRKPNGTLARSFKREVSIPAPDPTADGTTLRLFEALTVAPGRYAVSAVLSDPDADEPRAATRSAEVIDVPRGAPFLVGPILGRRAEPAQQGSGVGFEPLMTPRVEQGEPLEALTLVCIAEAGAPIEVPTIARVLTASDGAVAQAFDPTSAVLDAAGEADCHEVVDRVATAALEPGRYELTATAAGVAGSGSASFEIAPQRTPAPGAAISRSIRAISPATASRGPNGSRG